MKEFFKIFKREELIETILIISALYLLIDMFDIPSILKEKYEDIIIVFLILILVLVLINRKSLELIRINVYSYFDLIIVSELISNTFFIIFSKAILYGRFKLTICLLIEVILAFISSARLISIYLLDKKIKEAKEYTVYDIKKIYHNEINNTNNDLLFVEEKDVDYDLLNRNKIIEDLYNSIYYCKNKERFVISLTGKWGSGKTTIINNVKKQLNDESIIVISNFDTWKYNNEKALFYGMFDKIVKAIGINFSTLEVHRFVNSCIAIVSSTADIDIGLLSLDDCIIEKIKLIIGEYLEKNNKRVVFIIDNLERTNENNIILILKAISTILNINQFIYVLSYDENEMKDIFDKKLEINYDYMEKVVQLPLAVPEINKENIEDICSTCLKNILMHYGIDKNDIEKYEDAIKLFNKNIKDLRAFKRKLNSICNCCFYKENRLNRIDYFLIELIRYDNLELYNEIRKNFKYYVSEDYETVYGFRKENREEYNAQAEQYFKGLFEIEKNREFKQILCLMFPNVDKYDKESRFGYRIQFLNESSFINSNDKEKYRRSLIERRIFNAKYFELYFIKQENDFIIIDSKIKEFIQWNNQNKLKNDDLEKIDLLERKLSEILYMYEGIGQKFIIEIFELYCKELKNNKDIILMQLVKSHNNMDNTPVFLGLNAEQRLEVVCSEIMDTLNPNELSRIKMFMESNYKNMYFIRETIHWLEKNTDSSNLNNDTNIYSDLIESYEKMLLNVTDNNINIYTDENYSIHNIYSLIDREECKKQMKFINEKNVFAFLADMISISIGTNGYGYELDKESFNKLSSFEAIDSILSNIDDKVISKVEKNIKDIYNHSKENNSKSLLDDKSKKYKTYFDLRKIRIKD